MKTKLTLDQAGRVMIPKSFRDQLHLGPGDEMEVHCEGDEIRLRPVGANALLRKELGVWVLEGEAHSGISATEVIDQQRQARFMALLG